MKRISTLVGLALSGLLLTGCAVPESWDEFANWSNTFFVQIEASQIKHLFGPVFAFLAGAAVVTAVFGLLYDQEHMTGRYKSPLFIIFNDRSHFFRGFVILLSVGLAMNLIPISTKAGLEAMPPDLILDKVISALNWKLDCSGPVRCTLMGWAAELTLFLPTLSRLWQGVMLLASTIALATSLPSRSLKGLAFIFSAVTGWLMFLGLYNGFVTFLGITYPSWDIGSTAVVMNAAYLVGTVALITVCYVVAPMAATKLVREVNIPEPMEDVMVEQLPKTNKSGLKIDWGKIPSLFFIPYPVPGNGDDNDDTYAGAEESIFHRYSPRRASLERPLLPGPRQGKQSGTPNNPDQDPEDSAPTGSDATRKHPDGQNSRTESKNDGGSIDESGDTIDSSTAPKSRIYNVKEEDLLPKPKTGILQSREQSSKIPKDYDVSPVSDLEKESSNLSLSEKIRSKVGEIHLLPKRKVLNTNESEVGKFPSLITENGKLPDGNPGSVSDNVDTNHLSRNVNAPRVKDPESEESPIKSRFPGVPDSDLLPDLKKGG